MPLSIAFICGQSGGHPTDGNGLAVVETTTHSAPCNFDRRASRHCSPAGFVIIARSISCIGPSRCHPVCTLPRHDSIHAIRRHRVGRVIPLGADSAGVRWPRADRTRAPFEHIGAELPSALRGAWRCPACGTRIQHHDAGPRTDIVYRCTVCRLELVIDPETLRLGLAPLPENI